MKRKVELALEAVGDKMGIATALETGCVMIAVAGFALAVLLSFFAVA